ncbi:MULTISPECIES: hypothetical protein [Persicobacter]|uniref:Uncharacterized protein n=1 Tax=Persicobacter diffluens TaxID=981 RepID=A0AAN5AKE9_9BACT|nr:hypothetical protein [Persicobacter sp. CCB-QB2]GJM59818.1 hypothetical protein PEDI_03700 [Persicobacter diffluens]
MIEKIEAIEDQLNKIGPKGYKTLYEEIRQEQPLLSAFFLGFKMDGYGNYLQGALLRGIFAVYLYYKEEAFFQKKLGYAAFKEMRDEQLHFLEFMESQPMMISKEDLTGKMVKALEDQQLFSYIIRGFETSQAFNGLPPEEKGTIALEFKVLLELIQQQKK